MQTYTIIVPIERRRRERLVQLLELFKEGAKLTHQRITEVMPITTFYQLLYTLKLIERYVHSKYGFTLFKFTVKKREDGKMVKIMEPATMLDFIEIEGTAFVTFTKTRRG